MKKLIWRIACCLLPACCTGQNLVPNGSFEWYESCPPYPGQIHLAVAWDAPNNQTTDFFHACAPEASGAGVPVNLVGVQEPFDGEGYAGLRTWIPVISGNPPYREYLTVELKEPLEGGRLYELQARISVAESSSHLSNGLGFLLTEQPLPFRSVYKQAPDLRFPPQEFVEEDESWVLFYDTLRPQGSERYLTIGNFSPDTVLLRPLGNELPPTVYYYLDDIRLQACEVPELLVAEKDTFLCAGSALVLQAPEGALRYRWADGRYGQERSVFQPGIYALEAEWGCYNSEIAFRVSERDCGCRIKLPNPFIAQHTPKLPFDLDWLELTLYDTLGRKVGVFSEADLPLLNEWVVSGMYFWVAKISCSGQAQRQVGKVMVVR